MNAPQPPLPDIDWTEAVEAAHVAIFSALLDNGLVPTAAKHIADLVDAAALHAAWPILHAAAQPLDLCAPLPRRAEQGAAARRGGR